MTLHADVPEPAPLPATGETVGVDLGLTDFLVLFTGERIPHPRHMDRYEKRLKRYQRILARKQRGSKNRAKAAQKVARQHAKVADAAGTESSWFRWRPGFTQLPRFGSWSDGTAARR